MQDAERGHDAVKVTTGDPDIYQRGLDRGPANYQPLSPLSFLEWSAAVYPDKCAVIHGETRLSYAEFNRRCHRLAAALAGRGIGLGDTVAVMAPNVPAMLERRSRRSRLPL